jgi:hypothetical protein
VPFDSQESTIIARQDAEEETKTENIFNLRQESSSKSPPQQDIIPANNTSADESLLLDGFRSEKDVSTNRSSDLLHS